MAFTFQLTMAGLCAFVRNPRGDRARVLLVDARAGGHECAACKGSQPMRHWPKFVFKRPDLLGSSGRSYCQHKDGTACFDLDREDLILRKVNGDELGVPFKCVESRRAESTFPVDGREGRDYRWLAQMGGVASDAGLVAASALGPNPPYTVAARLAITDGELGTTLEWIAKPAPQQSSGAEAPPPCPMVWTFRPLNREQPRSRFRQALAGAAVLTVEVRAESLSIWSRSMARDGGSPWTVTLKPQDGKVEAFLGNMPSDGDTPPACKLVEAPGSVTPTPDVHFERFYELCAADWYPPRARLIPHPVEFKPPHVPPDNCPPTLFDDHPDA